MLLALFACSRCDPVPWDSMVFVDAGDDPVVAERVASSVAEFARWTGRDAACVSSITVVDGPAFPELDEEGEEHSAGYLYAGQAIEVSAQGSDPWGSTAHELCHAIEREAPLVEDNLSLFEDPWGALPEEEVYARLCEDGAGDIEARRYLEERCGLISTHSPVTELAALTLINDAVFPAAPRFPWSDPVLDVRFEAPWSLPVEGAQVTATADHIVLIDASEPGLLDLYWVAPLTGAVVAREALSLCPTCRWQVLSGDGEAWLQVEETGALWRLLPGGSEPVASLCTIEGFAVLDGVVWQVPSDSLTADPEQLQLTGCRLSTGEPITPEPPGAILETASRYGDDAWSQAAPVGGHPGVIWPEAGMVWWSESGWQSRSLPAYLSVHRWAMQPGGSMLLAIYHFEASMRVGLAWIDPATGAREAGEIPCEYIDVYDQVMLAGAGWAAFVGEERVTPVHVEGP